MVIQIINLVLSVVVGIAAGACLLRCYMQWFGSQLGPEQRKLVGVYLFPLTNWIVIPLAACDSEHWPLRQLEFVSSLSAGLGEGCILILLDYWRGQCVGFAARDFGFGRPDPLGSNWFGLYPCIFIVAQRRFANPIHHLALNEASFGADSTNDSEAGCLRSIATHSLACFANPPNYA